MLRILSIGSTDSSGGAGVVADAKTASALGAYCATAVVGVTAQDTLRVHRMHAVPPPVVAAQIAAVVADVGVDAVKVGTAWSAEVVAVIAEHLRGLAVPVVVDPVLGSASGSAIGVADGPPAVRALLMPVATVVTPNLGEARRLTGADGAEPEWLAEALVTAGASAALITDALPERGADWLFDGRDHHVIPGPRHGNGCEHGAGCAHSTALAVLLAQGLPLVAAATRAREIAGAAVRWGAAGIGTGVHPVDVLAGLRIGAAG